MIAHAPRVVSLRIPGVDFPDADTVLAVQPAVMVQDVVTRGEFWRRRPSRPPGYVAEAYLWGLRSTATGRALWMLLLPFTMMNVAYWARPARPRGITSWAADTALGVICRLLGLTLTITLVWGIAGVTMDLVAWQCLGGDGRCAQGWRPPLSLVAEAPVSTFQWLAIGALGPLLVLALLWLVSLRTWRRYERRTAIAPRFDPLTEARFWRGRDWVERLRATHVVAGMAATNITLLHPAITADALGSRPAFLTGSVLMASSLVALLAAVTAAVAPLPLDSPTVHAVRDGPAVSALRRSRRLASGARLHGWLADHADTSVAAWRNRARRAALPITQLIRIVAWCMVGITLCCLAYAAIPERISPPSAGAVPGFGFGVAVLSITQTILLIVMGISVLPLCWIARRCRRRPTWYGFAAPIIATVAVMLAVGEAASLLYFAALSMGQLETSTTGRAWTPAPPYPYEWAGLVFAVGLGAAVLAAAGVWLNWRRQLRIGRRLTDQRDPTMRHQRPDAADVLDSAHARGRLLEAMPRFALVVFVPITALSLIGVGYSAAGRGPSALLPSQQTLANLGAWFIGLAAVALVIAVARAGNTTPGRRLVSAIYATATFWPRATHPFAAPSHGPRAVADIARRITTLTDKGIPVLLAGHSHGSILAATALRYLPHQALHRTALLTSACPLTRLIKPFFAAFFDRSVTAEIAKTLTDERGTRWINLYRITDPIGGPVLNRDTDAMQPDNTSSIDQLAPDPPNSELAAPDPTVCGHGAYLRDPAFNAAHNQLVQVLIEPATSSHGPGEQGKARRHGTRRARTARHRGPGTR